VSYSRVRAQPPFPEKSPGEPLGAQTLNVCGMGMDASTVRVDVYDSGDDTKDNRFQQNCNW